MRAGLRTKRLRAPKRSRSPTQNGEAASGQDLVLDYLHYNRSVPFPLATVEMEVYVTEEGGEEFFVLVENLQEVFPELGKLAQLGKGRLTTPVITAYMQDGKCANAHSSTSCTKRAFW
mmetsp:Transcript_4620/g.15942  ORF Transcript_4620/g.15942 Transcript_4620/m.15942 type:complete len:118 (-) Transcript_4620:232-585(-)